MNSVSHLGYLRLFTLREHATRIRIKYAALFFFFCLTIICHFPLAHGVQTWSFHNGKRSQRSDSAHLRAWLPGRSRPQLGLRSHGPHSCLWKSICSDRWLKCFLYIQEKFFRGRKCFLFIQEKSLRKQQKACQGMDGDRDEEITISEKLSSIFEFKGIWPHSELRTIQTVGRKL